MCNKALVKLILKVNTNKCLKSPGYISYFNRSNFSHNSIVPPNLKQFTGQSRNLCLLGKNVIVNNNCNSFHNRKIQSNGATTPGFFDGVRSFCSKKDEVPKLMDFPKVVWPSVFKSVRNWILSNFIIMRYFDNEFNLQDFIVGSKQAVELVSGFISRGDVDSLAGLVTPEVISQVRNNLNTFNLKQRQEFAIKAEDIYFCFAYEVGVMFPNEDKNEGENQSRFVEITMCYHALYGLKELKDAGITLPVNMGVHPDYQDKIFICNYRFIREFTKGVQDDWTINAINHFNPSTFIESSN